MSCDSSDSETHHWWLKEGVMTILSFCALFPLLHVFSLQLSQHSRIFLLSFSVCPSSFQCCGGIACTFRPGYATHLSIYVENLGYSEVNSYLRFSPLAFFVWLYQERTQSCLGFSMLFLQLEGSLSNYFCSVFEDVQLFGNREFQSSLNILYVGSFTGIKVLLRKTNHQYYLF